MKKEKLKYTRKEFLYFLFPILLVIGIIFLNSYYVISKIRNIKKDLKMEIERVAIILRNLEKIVEKYESTLLEERKFRAYLMTSLIESYIEKSSSIIKEKEMKEILAKCL